MAADEKNEQTATGPAAGAGGDPIGASQMDQIESKSGPLTPIQIFAVSLAYIIDADRLRPNEEKAEIVTLLGKHVSRGEFTDKGLAELAQFAFVRTEKQPLEAFLEETAPRLSPLQMASIYMNVMEAMLVDGVVRESEQIVMKKFQDAFHLDQETVLAIRELIFVKNDTRMFLYPEHPRNSNDEFLAISYTRRRT
ncbi:MAG: Tellurite resistance protein TerB [Rhodospirillales bacterium]|nr:Tellurite resistance protein TerB [Rhodospirillales bacterium]